MKLPDLSWIDEERRSLFIAVGEIVVVAGLAWQAASLIWMLVPPTPATTTASDRTGDRDVSVLTRFDPFFRSAPAALTDATAQAFRLFGVRAGGGGSGSAIIGGPDGKQSSYSVGEEIAPGVRLESVAVDHVVLARGGARSTLSFPNATPDVAPEQVLP